MVTLWLRGLLAHRPLRVWGTALGVALTVAFLAVLGGFVASSTANMTARARAGVPVDWQVLLGGGADQGAVEKAVRTATAIKTVLPVGYADVAGFTATTGGTTQTATTQTTGAGKVLGLPDGYRAAFSSEIRPLIGSPDGVALSQQTAANLHVGVGDTVTVKRLGVPPVQVKVGGVVDLPQADSLFQAVGAPRGLAPQAPPDNVLLLPAAQFHALFGPQNAVRPDSVRVQLHVRLATQLPGDPGRAFALAGQLANNVEARVAGSAVVGNNLAARLGGAREDALYARALFLFLGLPGALLAGLLTLNVAGASAGQRRAEAALLRVRGASAGTVMRLAAAESVLVGAIGVAAGLALYVLSARLFLAGGANAGLFWLLIAGLSGLLLAALAVLVPTWSALRSASVSGARRAVGRAGTPLWQKLYLDVLLLAIAGIVFWRSAAGGYQLVLAPEGVAQSSIQIEAFLAPLALWIGATLLAVRILEGLLRRRALRGALVPLAGNLAPTVSAALARQRPLLSRGAALVALAVAFAVSTAIFNATYNDQARVDALLTNGADVAVTGTAAAPAGKELAALSQLPGVTAAQPLMHRFAYVGGDLQDIFGLDAAHFTQASRLANSYFANLTASQALAKLRARPDAVFVSQETVNDYRLNLGDTVRLRLLSARDHQEHVVPFTFVGVVREFPTAPKDSFLVANAAYLGQVTGMNTAEVALLRVSGDPAPALTGAQKVVQNLPGVRVTGLSATRAGISSSLTAVNLSGLSRIELAYAVLLLAGATGLVLALGLAERRRNFTVLSALGATGRQLGAFLWGEGLVVAGLGGLSGALIGLGVAQMLVKLLQGVFDPPPEGLLMPWAYLAGLLIAGALSTTLALSLARAASGRRVTEVLRSA